MAGITTDVCFVFPALSALKAGYDVYTVIDASGTWSPTAELASILRLTQAGAIVTNWVAVAAELKHDEAMNKTFSKHIDLYSFLGDIAAAKA